MVKCVGELDVYQRAYKSALEIHRLSLTFPKHEQWSLGDQLRRASRSICANVAEGFAKNNLSGKEFKRLANIAFGSSEEVLIWLDFAKDFGYLKSEEWARWKEEYQIISKQLFTMIKNWKE